MGLKEHLRLLIWVDCDVIRNVVVSRRRAEFSSRLIELPLDLVCVFAVGARVAVEVAFLLRTSGAQWIGRATGGLLLFALCHSFRC